jgi:hypothetical protein
MTTVVELTDRARDVFRIVVESYLDSGAPIGSRTISKLGPLNLSPASIRNVMQDLEELGLLVAPQYLGGADAHRNRPTPVRRWHDAGGRTHGGRARRDRGAGRAGV